MTAPQIEPQDETGLPRTLNPAGWRRPSGYSNGMTAKGRVVVTGGLVGWDQSRRFPPDFAGQARQTFENIIAVLREGGAGPEHLIRLTWYVTDLAAYRNSRKEIGAAYREIIGPHYPAMAVIGISGLLEPAAMVEIEATAVVPD